MMEGTDVSRSIREDNDFFKRLVDMIPAQVHYDKDMKNKIRGEVTTDEEDSEPPSKKQKKKHKIPKADRKKDPMKGKTVTELQEELDNRAASKHEEGDGKTKKKKKKKKKENDDQEDHVRGISHTGSLEDLREKLHARIEELKGKRGQKNPEEWMERKRLMRKESKLKLKMRRRKEKLNPVKGDNSRNSLSNGEVASPAKPVFNKEGKMVFSKFDFSESEEKVKKPMADLTGKDYRKILENLEKRKEKVKKLQDTNVVAARDLQKKSAWQAAIGKAEGVKIKDDPELLKKAIKRKEKRKKKSTKAWEVREEKTDQKKKERQEKRQKNIDSRKQTKQKNKMKKAAKKGRIVPGF